MNSVGKESQKLLINTLILVRLCLFMKNYFYWINNIFVYKLQKASNHSFNNQGIALDCKRKYSINNYLFQ